MTRDFFDRLVETIETGTVSEDYTSLNPIFNLNQFTNTLYDAVIGFLEIMFESES